MYNTSFQLTMSTGCLIKSFRHESSLHESTWRASSRLFVLNKYCWHLRKWASFAVGAKRDGVEEGNYVWWANKYAMSCFTWQVDWVGFSLAQELCDSSASDRFV